ncbi:MAG TPA: glucosaminidase, partial [Parabacteroides merdae]|nr:glucosaminidase [Parabacteroides merdae]
YISEVNGDNRAAYQALLVKVCRKISKLIPHPINHNS